MSQNNKCEVCAGFNRVKVQARHPVVGVHYWMDCPVCRPSSSAGLNKTGEPQEAGDKVVVKGKYKVHGLRHVNECGKDNGTLFHDSYEKAMNVATNYVNNSSNTDDKAVIFKAVEVVEVDRRPVKISGVV